LEPPQIGGAVKSNIKNIIANFKNVLSHETQVLIVDKAISISKPMANENGISLECQKIRESTCFVKVDPLRFKQIILNLIANAIKYNKPNGSVVVSYENQTNGKMRIGVRDTGVGLPDDKKDLIFEPFERIESKTTYIEGSGIGLAISK
jgi:signal transduction histidine kinase